MKSKKAKFSSETIDRLQEIGPNRDILEDEFGKSLHLNNIFESVLEGQEADTERLKNPESKRIKLEESGKITQSFKYVYRKVKHS